MIRENGTIYNSRAHARAGSCGQQTLNAELPMSFSAFAVSVPRTGDTVA